MTGRTHPAADGTDRRPEPGFEWRVPTRVVFGTGRLREVGNEVAALGGAAVVVVDRRLAPEPAVRRTLASLVAAHVPHRVVEIERPDPRTVCRIADTVGSAADVLVGIGGGSVIDPVKVASLVVHDGRLRLALGTAGTTIDLDSRHPRGGVPVVAVPTTPHTGSDANGVAVVDHGARQTLWAGGALCPSTALVDPDVFRTLSPTRLRIGAFEVWARLVVTYAAHPAVAGVVDQLARAAIDDLAAIIECPEEPSAPPEIYLLSLLSGSAALGFGRPATAQTLWYAYAACRAAVPHATKGEILAALFADYVRHVRSVTPIGAWLGDPTRLAEALGPTGMARDPIGTLRRWHLPTALGELTTNGPETVARTAVDVARSWAQAVPDAPAADLAGFIAEACTRTHIRREEVKNHDHD
ncbi:MAG: iron-containing alcohol dehydrogenase [Acidimicrobiales bacterium]